MVKNEIDPHAKMMNGYPEINDISQGISKILEEELRKLVDSYNG
jgi:hypothetical protein